MPQALISRPAVRVAGDLHDRCDRCGAQAKLLARFPSGGGLTFCGHHANKYAAWISAAAEAVVVVPHFTWAGAVRRGRHSAE